MPAVGTTHSVKIGDEYYILRPGSYRKRPAPQFGPRFTTGDPDWNNLSAWQHWAQTCWVGGFGAPTWRDDAMFDEGVGIDARQHEVMMLARDLGPAYPTRSAENWDLEGEQLIRIFKEFNGILYALQVGGVGTSRLYYYTGSGSWILLKTFAEEVAWMEEFAGHLVFGDAGSTLNRMNTSQAFDTIAKPSGRTSPVRTLKVYNGKLYVGLGREIWRLKSDWTWDGSTPFYTAENVNYLNQSELHLGFLYFASRNGHILRTDGNNTFDMWAFEPHVTIWGIRSFDGRLFIGTAEELEGTDSQQTVLYQFSGAAVTELKRWGRVGYDCTPGKLRAFEGKLFFGASNLLGLGETDGFGIGCYDPVEDAFHIFASNQDSLTYGPGTEGVWNTVDDIAFYKGYLYCSVRYHGIFRTPWSYQDASRELATFDNTAAGGSVGGKNGGWYESSDFDAGTPGLQKLWHAITLHVDLPNAATSLYVEVSSDGGVTWFPAGGDAASATVSKTGAETRYAKTIVLQDTNPALADGFRGTRLKYRITLRTTDTAYSPFLRGVIVHYLPIPEPNWMWTMTLVLSERQELLDGSTEDPDNATKLAALRSAFRTQSLVHFTEPGGVQYNVGGKGVLIHDYEERLPVIAASSLGPLEYEVQLTLLEMREQYEG